MKKINKTTNIILRVTEEDKKYIKEQAALANMNVSQFILTTAYNTKIVVNNNIPELLLGMTRIGTNINQIAHLCNSQKSVNNNLLDSVLKKQKELKKLADEDSTEFGIILRAKGIVPALNGKTWYEFDLTPGEYEIREAAPDYTGRLCVIGSELKEDKVAELWGI